MDARRAWTGAAAGALLSLPLFAAQLLVEGLTGLAVPAYAAFDWLARALPGGLITFGIDAMVKTITQLGLGQTSSVAKLLEQGMAFGLMTAVGAAVGALVYARAAGRPAAAARSTGLLAGALVGLVVGLFALVVGEGFGAAAWAVASYLAWGWALARVREGLLPAGTAAADEERRTFLVRVGAATATITVVGAGVGALLRGREGGPTADPEATPATVPTPRAEAVVPTGAEGGFEPAKGTRPEYTPIEEHYRIDINLRPPDVRGTTWRLLVDGLVDRELNLTYDQLVSRPTVDHVITLACISNLVGGDLIGTTRWTGIPLKAILEEAGIQPEAVQLKVSAADGFEESLDVSLAMNDERVMLAWAMDGKPLTSEHGFPLRIYIPDRYGMKQPKWIERIEAVGEPYDGYWVTRGWDSKAIMRTTSVIDAVATDMMVGDPKHPMIAVGGIAHGGARGISKVEVQVDDGPWQEAQLKPPLSELTWVIWRYDWRFEPGRHTFRVRATDGSGAPQITDVNPPRPSGATGLHELDATV